MERDWRKECVVYQIYPRSFMDSNGDGIGDLGGILQKLDYLKELGVDVIWLSPVYKSPNDDNGYDISDYKDIMDEFGTMEDFDVLLAGIHKRGMKIMMDLVVNHSSDEHEWFEKSCAGIEPYDEYYIWRDEPNNWTACFGGSAWKYDDNRKKYYLHLFSKKQPDLNWSNAALRKEVYTMMEWWLKKGIDGFRMDVINFIGKDEKFPDGENGSFGKSCINLPIVHDYLQEMNREVLSKYDIITVGEMPDVTVEQAQKYTSKDELNMVFQFEHMDLDNNENGKWCDLKIKLTELKKVLSKWQTGLHGTGWNSLYWNNHDRPRIVSRLGDDGEYRELSAKMLGTCLHMMQGTPYIYQGEELGMTNVSFDSIYDYRDIETLNAYAELADSLPNMMKYIHMKSRDNARTPMHWNDSANAGFTTGEPWIKLNPNYKQINAEAALNDKNSIFYYYKKLIQLRKQNLIIVYGDYKLLLPDDESIFAYERNHDGHKLTVLCNFSAKEAYFDLDVSGDLLIANYDDSGKTNILRAYEARVYIN